MEVDWDKRRRNLRILMANANIKPSPLANSVGLSSNVITQFLNGKTVPSHQTLERILPALGLTNVSDLDADNVLDDPRVSIRRMIELVPDEDLEKVLMELRERFPDLAR